MQTFLPYPEFSRSAETLDLQRLGKQIIEGGQIMRALLSATGQYGWQDHPVTALWFDRPDLLMLYVTEMTEEWQRRRGALHGAYTNLIDWLADHGSSPQRLTMLVAEAGFTDSPWWLGHPGFHASHRSNLLRKDAAHYGQFGWTEPHDLPYAYDRVTAEEIHEDLLWTLEFTS